MNLEVKKLWLDALRSGKYQQGRRRLKIEQKCSPAPKIRYCCLGVLCELAVEAGVIPPSKLTTEEFGGQVHEFNAERSHLPTQVINWAGLQFTSGGEVHFPNETNAAHLTDANDYGKTFLEIADAIERTTDL